MHLKTLSIKNFRAIEHIDVELAERVSVIVGPNAIGKTTILEAIRLAKAILAPRTSSEAAQALISIGAASPHIPHRWIGNAVARDPAKTVEIRCGYQLDHDELTSVTAGKPQLVTALVRSRFNANIDPSSFAAVLSSSQGHEAMRKATDEVDKGLEKLQLAKGICRLDLFMDFQSGQISTPDPTDAMVIRYLDETLRPSETKFSYFPADRALPRGEQPIQLGAQDAAQQLESHNSQPQNKYNRLKNTIFSAIIEAEDGRQAIRDNFYTIFSGLLKGRELVGAGVNEFGLLTINVRDLDTGRIFDIDAMSSGEKGLILTFLLIERSLVRGGVALLDEPELHLNPAVCKELLAFMIEAYVIPKNLQVVLCSHSPEILAGAFGREECALYHLVSGTLLTRVRQSDESAITEALRQLGTSESEGLLYRATIFVEGEHDVELLERGFGSLLRQYKIKDLGGRTQIERYIRQLQDAETSGRELTPRYFIFDKDDVPTNLVSTKNTKVLQWDRRCLENYLIDVEVIADLLMDDDITRKVVANLGEVSSLLKKFALGHLDDAVVREIYDRFSYDNPGLRLAEVQGKSFETAGEALFDRLERLAQQIGPLERSKWASEFLERCEARKKELWPLWDSEWKELCDGKRLFLELQQSITLKMPLLSFKLRIMERMRNVPTRDNWRAIEGLLKGLIGVS